jgi:predicted aldo/keto reductase-like oxidoreductase
MAAGLGSGVAFAASNKKDEIDKIEIKAYSKFGNTGFTVSDISSGNPSSESVLKALLNKGVNLIDTGEAYGNGNSEKLIGKVIKDFDRSKIFINTKLYTEKEFPSKKEVIQRTNQCLERLETDYVDCMQIHSVENTTLLKDKAFHSAMKVLKKEGKVRHLGISCHGNNWAYNTEENLEKIMMTAIEDGRFEVLLLAYNFVNSDIGDKILNACAQKNIATMIMKSNPVFIYNLMENRVNKLTEEKKEIDEYTQAFYDKYKVMQESASDFFKAYGITDESELLEAASKFVLSNPNAHTTLWDFKNFDDINKMLHLSGQKLELKDKQVLQGYHKYLGNTSCRIGCNDCEAACPEHLPVNKILRYNYYFSVKKQEKRAMQKFAGLKSKKPSEVCLECPGYCEKACKYGVSTQALLAMAQSNMEFVV